mgnify:CR=1 FL=1
MESQDNLLQDKNLSGPMEMVMDLKNLMLMVISRLGALVKGISIKKLNNLGFHQQMDGMLNLEFLKIVTL